MKRIIAFIIDFLFIMVTFMLLSGVIIYFIIKYNISQEQLMFLMGVICILTVFLYFFYSDFVRQGSSVGKRIIGIKMVCRDNRISWRLALVHTILKTVCGIIYPISAFYYISKHEIFYDKMLGIKTVDFCYGDKNNETK